MSFSDEDNINSYGTPLEPYDEDTIPKKKAFTIEDQIATDDQGRRRFHGAFTGGFSAGFFNTVGSLEGWKPTEFKSSRSEKAAKKFQTPHDFMDDEDMGQFGIAPTVVRATSDYSNTVKRKRVNNEGPIPGMPVLHSLLQPAKDTVGIKLLKRMGWRPGQGVGPRLTKSQKTKANREHKRNLGKVYGCEVPDQFRKPLNSTSEDSSSEDETELTFAPDDYDPFIYKPKDNTFGMGYSGLDKRSILSSHITLFNPPEFKMRDHKNSKVSISGQAFGVGAFENEDEDIYSRDDMSKYDFQLDSNKSKSKKTAKKVEKSAENMLDGFVQAKNPVQPKKTFAPPVLPKNFIAKHGVRISRFEPLPETHELHNYDRKKTMGRHDLTSSERSKILNSSNSIITNSRNNVKQLVTATFNPSEEEEKKLLQEKASKITSDLPSTSDGTFKPFIADPDKQKRYEEYLSLIKLDQRDKIGTVQLASMSDWEKEFEKREFEQASHLYKPVAGLIFDKFVTASAPDDTTNPLKPVERSIYLHGSKEMREAAKNKRFGQLTRTIELWKPNKLLCKRFNVPEPEISESDILLQTRKKRGKYSVFDYYEAYQTNKVVKEGPEPVKEVVKETSKPKPVEDQRDYVSLNTANISMDHNSSTEVNANTIVSLSDIPLPASTNTSSQITSSVQKNTYSVPPKSSTTSLESFQNISVKNNNPTPFESDISSRSESFIKSVLKSVTVSSVNLTSTPTTSNSPLTNKSVTVLNERITKDKQQERNITNNVSEIREISRKSKLKLPEPATVSLPTDPKEKLDLFKAIFLSSSEDENEIQEQTKSVKNKQDKTEEMKKIILQEDKGAPVINTEIKKDKKGIFADLDWNKINKKPDAFSTNTKEKEREEIIEDEKTEDKKKDEVDMYGPKLPAQVNLAEWKPTFQKVNKKADKYVSSSSEDEEWMEIDASSKEKRKKDTKKHKKHKSEKKSDRSKHKKHKSKHKKKKHSDK